MNKIISVVALGIGIFALVVVFALLLAWPTMYLINFVFAPTALLAVFGVAKISFWQTYALMVLCGILFKSSNSNSNRS